MTESISMRPDAGQDKYGDNQFLPKDVKERLNRLIRKHKVDIPQDFCGRDGESGDLFGDEAIVMTQLEEIGMTDKEDKSDAAIIEAAISKQLDKYEQDKVYFVYAPSENHPDVRYFIKLGHIYDGE